jgi:hypothetical protein
MINIISPNDDFDFSSIYLGYPTSQNGSFFTKIYCQGKPLYIQTPKSQTKQGFIKNGKKIHTELMFSNTENLFIKWLENLETKCQELIFEKNDDWFQEKLELNDIESAFTNLIKVYRSGKNYLLRTNVKINQTTNEPTIKIYNENEVPLTIEDITSDKNVISVIEIQGIKFSSKNFQIELELKQMMMLIDNEVLFDKCLINREKKEEIMPVSKEVILKENVLEMDDDAINSDDEKEEEDKSKDIKVEHLANKDTSEISELTDFDLDENLIVEEEMMTLKKREEVYYKIYREARKKARILKHQALLAFLEAKNIKKTYMLEDLEEDDSVISDLDFKSIEQSLNYNLEV